MLRLAEPSGQHLLGFAAAPPHSNQNRIESQHSQPTVASATLQPLVANHINLLWFTAQNVTSGPVPAPTYNVEGSQQMAAHEEERQTGAEQPTSGSQIEEQQQLQQPQQIVSQEEPQQQQVDMIRTSSIVGANLPLVGVESTSTTPAKEEPQRVDKISPPAATTESPLEPTGRPTSPAEKAATLVVGPSEIEVLPAASTPIESVRKKPVGFKSSHKIKRSTSPRPAATATNPQQQVVKSTTTTTTRVPRSVASSPSDSDDDATLRNHQNNSPADYVRAIKLIRSVAYPWPPPTKSAQLPATAA